MKEQYFYKLFNKINEQSIELLYRYIKVYKSVDTATDQTEAMKYSNGFLNNLESPGVTPNRIIQRKLAPIILL